MISTLSDPWLSFTALLPLSQIWILLQLILSLWCMPQLIDMLSLVLFWILTLLVLIGYCLETVLSTNCCFCLSLDFCIVVIDSGMIHRIIITVSMEDFSQFFFYSFAFCLFWNDVIPAENLVISVFSYLV